jgi:predicted glycoside hydrolase/deacetylase ChbG (UPF0249 family)
MAVTSLVEELGYGEQDLVLILTADDLGACHAVNTAVYDGLRQGLATTAGLMVPGPWARSAAGAYRGEDVGVHLTLNAELDSVRWGPLTAAPSLLDGDGGFPRTLADLWQHCDLDELRRECRAQVERAIVWGFDVTHLAAHLGAMWLRPELFDVYLELAVEFRLPIRLSGPSDQGRAGFPFRELAAEAGVLAPDELLPPPGTVGARAALEALLADPRPGVVEVRLHPALDQPELRALCPDWPERVDDLELLTGGGPLHEALQGPGVHLAGYRQLREVMRRRTSADQPTR